MVLAEVRATDEGLPALLTLVWLLAGVDLLVSTKFRASAEGLPALLTPVGLLAAVALLMMCQL